MCKLRLTCCKAAGPMDLDLSDTRHVHPENKASTAEASGLRPGMETRFSFGQDLLCFLVLTATIIYESTSEAASLCHSFSHC